MAVAISTVAKNAHANRLAGGSSLLQAKYAVIYDSAGIAVRTIASDSAVTVPSGALNTVNILGTATCPVGVTTPIIGGYIIGDVGTYHIDSLADAIALCAGAPATFAYYIIATITGANVAVTAADDVKVDCTLTF